MKTVTKLLITIPGFALIMLSGCTASKEDPLYEECQLTRIYYPGDTAGLSTRYYYDETGRLTLIKATNYEISFSYSGNKVIKDEAGYKIEFTIGPDSTALYSENIKTSPADQLYRVEYFYDANKYLIKSVGWLDGVLWDSTENVIVNGNVTQTTWYQHGAAVDIVNDYSFFEDLSAKTWAYTKMAGDYGYFYYPWMGRPNKNLVKKHSQGIWGIGEYQYEMNASGFINKVFYTSLASNPPYTETWLLEHNCQ